MKRTLLALLIGAGFATGANAAVVFTDNFSIGAGQSASETGAGVDISSTINLLPPLGNPDLFRTLSVSVPPPTLGLESKFRVTNGGLAAGSNDPGQQGTFYLTYSGSVFNPFDNVAGTVSFDLLFLDLAPAQVSLFVPSLGPERSMLIVPTPQTMGSTTYSLSYTGDYDGFFSNGFTLAFAGPTAFDIVIDNVRFSVPEPTSIALLGLGLLGAGLARRKVA